MSRVACRSARGSVGAVWVLLLVPWEWGTVFVPFIQVSGVLGIGKVGLSQLTCSHH